MSLSTASSQQVDNELDFFFDADKVAVIGASPKKSKLSNILMKNISDSKSVGKLFPVNPNYDRVLGRKCYDSVLHIPNEIDLAVISLPAELTPGIVKECVRKSVSGLVLISSGFSELEDDEGKELEKKIASNLDDSDTRLIGPNTLGFYVPDMGLDVMFLKKDVFSRPMEGSIGLLSQSGSLAVDFLNELHEKGTGVSLFLNLGNKLDIDENDLIEYMDKDERTECISLYLESISDGERFFHLCREVVQKKPIVILKGGKSESGGKAASLHTGKMGGDYKITRDMFDQIGIIEADDEIELLDFSKTFANLPRCRGSDVLIVTNGGGNGIVAADLLELNWKDTVDLTELSDEVRSDFTRILPDYISPNNPIDLSAEAANQEYIEAIRYALENELSDIILVGITVNQTLDGDLIREIGKLKKEYEGRIIIYHKGFSEEHEILQELRKSDIPTFPSVKRSVNALGVYMRWHDERRG